MHLNKSQYQKRNKGNLNKVTIGLIKHYLELDIIYNLSPDTGFTFGIIEASHEITLTSLESLNS